MVGDAFDGEERLVGVGRRGILEESFEVLPLERTVGEEELEERRLELRRFVCAP